MTDKTQPEALRLALSIDLMDTFTDYQQEELNKAAAELRRQHARIAELEAQLEAVGAGGVQALSAAPAGAAPKAPPVCPDCNGTGVDGDVGNDGRVVDCVCGGCAGSGKARFLGKCPDGMRCLHGCLVDEQCHLDRRAALAASPPAEQQAATPESGAIYAELPDFESGDEPIWKAVFNWKAATPGSDAHKKAMTVESAIIKSLRDFADRTHALRMQAAPKAAPGEPMVEVTKHDANNYCLILRELGMDGEGDPVAEVRRLVAAPQQEAQDSVSPRHPVVMQWRDNAIEACAKIADAYGHEHAAQDMRAMLTAPQQEAQEPCGWDGAEEWEKLAWHLCAEENGEDACHELIWEGGPMPEPWGDRWLKYEGEARRMIALVRTHVPAPRPAPAPLSDDVVRDAEFEAVRKKLCALPRYSFVLDDDGLIRRVQDRVGNWIEFNEAHALFDPVSVDAARKQGVNHD